jgi:hypothetical protein
MFEESDGLVEVPLVENPKKLFGAAKRAHEKRLARGGKKRRRRSNPRRRRRAAAATAAPPRRHRRRRSHARRSNPAPHRRHRRRHHRRRHNPEGSALGNIGKVVGGSILSAIVGALTVMLGVKMMTKYPTAAVIVPPLAATALGAGLGVKWPVLGACVASGGTAGPFGLVVASQLISKMGGKLPAGVVDTVAGPKAIGMIPSSLRFGAVGFANKSALEMGAVELGAVEFGAVEFGDVAEWAVAQIRRAA